MNTAKPEDLGLSSARLQRVNRVMQRHVDEDRAAGVLTMVARRGEVCHFERFGMMDREASRSMQDDTIFRIYSMTKPIASVAAMMLYEEGFFQLDDPVYDFVPELRGQKVFAGLDNGKVQLTDRDSDVTIRQLLTHTAGIGYGNGEDSPVETMYREANVLDPESTLEEMVGKLAGLPLMYQPGTVWRYSVATDVLGYLVEAVSGQPFDAFLDERIFRPLGMGDTGFHVPEEELSRLAAVYGPAPGGGIRLVDPPSGSRFARPASWFSGGGGLVSTAADYLRFCQMLLNGGELDGVRLLGPKTIDLMTSSHLPDAMLPIVLGDRSMPGFGFGLGFRVSVDVPQTGVAGSEGEYGWGGAAGTYFWVDPVEDVIGVLMIQLMPYHHLPIREQFNVLVNQAIVE